MQGIMGFQLGRWSFMIWGAKISVQVDTIINFGIDLVQFLARKIIKWNEYNSMVCSMTILDEMSCPLFTIPAESIEDPKTLAYKPLLFLA